MKHLPIIHDSFKKEELLAQLDKYVEEIIQFYESIPLDIYRARCSEKGWTIEGNYKHISNSTRTFNWLIKLPRFILKLFGKPKNPELSVKDFGPPTDRPDALLGKYIGKGEITLERRNELEMRWRKVNENFRKSIECYTEEELDSYKAPFGGYTIRQFVLFTMLHNVHHTNVVRKRLEDSKI